MNTTVYTPSRRRSISAYNAMINSRNERQSQKTVILEEEKKNTFKETQVASQDNINGLCNDIQSYYTSMVKSGKDMKQCQDELDEKLKEEELFYSTADEIYSYNDVNEGVLRKMNLRRLAYYTLPLLDCFFSYFALYPIVTSKIADLSAALAGFAVIIGAVLSIVVGLGVSLISRLGVASLEEDEGSAAFRELKILIIGGSVVSLPLMYIIGEVSFNGGSQWTYSGCFAFISLIIQLLIVSGYKSQVEALQYFQNKKQSESIKHIKETDEFAIHGEISSLREKMKSIMDSFNQKYVSFTEKFRSLVIARDEFIQKFGHDAKYYLDQMSIYYGNLVCFHKEALPLYHEANGRVVSIPFVDFPYVAGGNDIFLNNDYVYLDYMMQRANSDTSLSETLRIIKEQRRKMNPQTSTPKEQTLHDMPISKPSKEDKFNEDLSEKAKAPIVITNSDDSYVIQDDKYEMEERQLSTLKNIYYPELKTNELIEEPIKPESKEVSQNVDDDEVITVDNDSYVTMGEKKKSNSHPWLKAVYDFACQMFEEE